MRPLVALVALVAAMAALLLAYGASPTHAAGSCSTTSGTTTCTYSSTGSEDTFKVPLGVSTIHVVATGAPGGVGVLGDAAGRGARVSADLAVSPGQTLYVNVGGTPTGGSNCDSNVACNGGFNGGGSSDSGGGGGGASDVRTVSRSQSGSLASRLIVAAGGGGSGSGVEVENEFCGGPPGQTIPLFGGGGGDAGWDGGFSMTQASGSCFADEGTGGGAGTQTAGGDGGLSDGESGTLGQGGGAAPGGAGGAGGGGLYGGGGGDEIFRAGDPRFVSSAGGGGGGSNLVPEGGTATLDDSGVPSIVISYQGGLGEEPPTEPEDKQACKKGGWKELGFKNQGQCIKADKQAQR